MNRLAVLATCLLVGSASMAAAQAGDVQADSEPSSPPDEAQALPDWSRNCSGDACQVARGMTESKSGKLFLTISVLLRKDVDGGKLAIAAPLGIAVQNGVTLGGGRDFRTLPVATCLSSGCLVEAAMDEVSLGLFASQDSVTISFLPYGKEEKLRLDMPLTGLPEAIEAARKELGG